MAFRPRKTRLQIRVNTLNWDHIGIVIHFRGLYRYRSYLNKEMVFKFDEGNYNLEKL